MLCNYKNTKNDGYIWQGFNKMIYLCARVIWSNGKTQQTKEVRSFLYRYPLLYSSSSKIYYSIDYNHISCFAAHTLLCSGEHKNPSGDGLKSAYHGCHSDTNSKPCRLGAKVQPLSAWFSILKVPQGSIRKPQAATALQNDTSEEYSLFICRRIDWWACLQTDTWVGLWVEWLACLSANHADNQQGNL